MSPVHVSRLAQLPDPYRVERCRRNPELGPRILFFSGGSALRSLSQVLKLYTHNSIHLITPFDSGGSSAHLRKAFQMLSVGDLRNRLMALADESLQGNPAIYALFSHRFSQQARQNELVTRLTSMVHGDDILIQSIPAPMRQLIQTHLRLFLENMPSSFDLRGASIGNLLLAGGYLHHKRDMDAVIYMFSKLVEVRGLVLPIVDVDLHLSATLEDGSRIVGQHELTGKERPKLASKVKELGLVKSLHQPITAEVTIPSKVVDLIQSAEVICYPMGSFYSSLLANLLPKGVGKAIVNAHCPKVFIPNMGEDPEQIGMRLSDSVATLLRQLRKDADGEYEAKDLVAFVLVDRQNGNYAMEIDLANVEKLGVKVIDVDLTDRSEDFMVEPTKLTEILVSMA